MDDGGIDFPGYGRKPEAQSLPIHRFDAKGAGWSATAEPLDVECRELTCVTFNTWFQGPEHAARYGALIEVLGRTAADVVMLQECTEQLLQMLLAAPWLRERYCLARAPFRADAIPSHGLLLLSRLPLTDATLHPVPTNMGRSALIAHCRANGTPLALATVHLESMKAHAETRAEQLRAIFALLAPEPDVLLGGDFNFCSSWPEENARLDSRYVDVWPAVMPSDPGFTRPGKPVRFDRLLGRGRWRPTAARLLGTTPIDKVLPSDHFGLAATFRFA
jgi:endonuclease/exonuclease/phosphatase family metal-dependent hydrolase